MVLPMKLTITVDTRDHADGGPDPKDTDPHDIAEWMVDLYNEANLANGDTDDMVRFVSAEWDA